EMLTSGQINDYCNDIKGIGIIEPSDTFGKLDKVMIGRTLTTADENVPVRLMNPSNEEVIVYRGTIVGQFEQVKEETDKRNPELKKNSQLPEQLKDLIRQASENLDDTEIESVKKTLTQYQDVFALTDEQLGRT
ncbi:MAG: eukaryotic translation initiation factor 3 subunit J, partial [Candidatus Thiodiazotropha endolucinida]|nr:eukaryotic translation initiation factor 3 subunit J [Candidatus Thiodiazotropha taylori]MCW4263949.1 eukaryotic translation initiation factor 3 subunit J [Candidatus Thiodiazotropha endolucinida]